MGKRELVVLLSLSSWCLVIVVWLFLAVPWVCLQFVIVVFPDHTLLLFLDIYWISIQMSKQFYCHLSLDARKPVFGGSRTTKAQASLRRLISVLVIRFLLSLHLDLLAEISIF